MRSRARSSVERSSRADRLLGVRDAVEDHGLHGIGVAPQVQLRHSRAVGGAVEIDLLITERDARPLEVLHGDARGVVAYALAVAREAIEGRLLHGRQLVARLAPVLRIIAKERFGQAGAALIDEHDVVVAIDARKGAGVAHVQIARRLARAARQQEQRRGARPSVEGGDHRDVQSDLAAGRLRRVLRDLQHAAARRHRGDLQGVLETALVQRQRALRGRTSAPSRTRKPKEPSRRVAALQ